MYLGGGGGAGDSNNGTGTPGGRGGGIVYLLSGGAVSGSGAIHANGESVATSTGTPGDAGGGGGGGGTIIIFTYSAPISNLTLNANGGNGGSQSLNNGAEVEGNGGGGGGGYISTSNANSLTRNVNGGSYGTTNAPPMSSFTANGATSGGVGTITTGPPNPYTTSTPLPVKLKSFSAKPANGTVQLQWVTSSEINNDYFTLEKSQDGEYYSELAKVIGAGNSTLENVYEYSDDSQFTGKMYYRLSQTDYDGEKETFAPVLVNRSQIKSDAALTIRSVHPVPFRDKLFVSVESRKERTIEIRIASFDGKMLNKQRQSIGAGLNTCEVKELSGVLPGSYILYVFSEGEILGSQKILKY
jgi:hypothetical protein